MFLELGSFALSITQCLFLLAAIISLMFRTWKEAMIASQFFLDTHTVKIICLVHLEIFFKNWEGFTFLVNSTFFFYFLWEFHTGVPYLYHSHLFFYPCNSLLYHPVPLNFMILSSLLLLHLVLLRCLCVWGWPLGME